MLVHDLKFALRGLRKSPGFTSVAVLSLALGIGANTAIFSLIDRVMLRMLPVPEAHRVVTLGDPTHSSSGIGLTSGERDAYTYPEYLSLRDNPVVEGVYAVQSFPYRSNVAVGGGSAAKEPANLQLVSGNLFSTLGVPPAIGRFFGPEEGTPGTQPVVVISYAYWQRRFGLSPAAIGQTVRIQGHTFTIIGAGRKGFTGDSVGEGIDIWLPATMVAEVMPGRDMLRQPPGSTEKVFWLRLGGRLKAGVTPELARDVLSSRFRRFLEEEGVMGDKKNVAETRVVVYRAGNGASSLRGNFSEPLLVMMTLVGLVLLIACANVANLLLARSAAREREVSIRLALGAGRAALVRQVMVESVLLALGGGVVGTAMAYWASQLLLAMASRGEPIALDVTPDLRVLGFAFLISLITGVLFGAFPAWRLTRVDVNPVLKDHARGTIESGGRRRWLSVGRLLVAGQVGLSIMMLIGAGLFVRSLQNLADVRLGYEAEHLLSIEIDPALAGYTGKTTPRLYERMLDRLNRIPGVKSASLSQNGLFQGRESGDQISVEGYKSTNKRDLTARFDQVGPGYFHTVGIPVVLGREFGSQDITGAPRVCLINETMAKFYFGNQNPLGRHMRDEFPGVQFDMEIVGVVKDAKYNSVREQTPRRFYVPFLNSLDGQTVGASLLIRTDSDTGSVVAAVRKEVENTDAKLEIGSVGTVGVNVSRSLTQDRLIARLAAFFGILALTLAALGLYGVLAYTVARRTAEIGIRMALGAQRGRVLRMVLGDSLITVVMGLAAGIPAAVGASRWIESRLFGLKAEDPATIAGAVTVLVTVAMLAAFLPAWRASRVDPMGALRWE